MKDKLKSAILGFVVGDALGVPYEFKKRDTFLCTDMIGYGTWNQPAGTWSDDSSMVLATLDTITKDGNLNLNKLMNNFIKWQNFGKYTPHGKCFDIGHGTRKALQKFSLGVSLDNCGGRSEQDNGNGALMRILPLAFFDYGESVIDDVAALTHNTTRSKFACEMYIRICNSLIDGSFDPDDPYLFAIKNLPRDKVRSTGYVLDTLVAVIWSFLNTHCYKDCVLTAVNLGDDTDTVAALAGGLAGLAYGVDSIPTEWVVNVAKIDEIIDLCDKFSF